MISASATTEQKIKGQIGHPAACMIESKVFPLGAQRLCGGIMADACGRFPGPVPGPAKRSRKVSTDSVDNSVGKLG
jgi:hypothetical protein